MVGKIITKLKFFIFLGIFMIGVVSISGCIQVPQNPTPTPTPAPIVIKITEPKEGDIVPISTIVSGIVSGEMPEGRYMWLAVNPQKAPGQWWPQGGQITPLQGKWDIQTKFGEAQDAGTKFEIAVILINKEDNQYYQDYLTKGQKTGSYPGIPLPASAKIMDSISVMRE